MTEQESVAMDWKAGIADHYSWIWFKGPWTKTPVSF